MLSALIIFASGLVQGMTSFGFSILAVPLLGLLLPMKTLVPLLILYSLVINVLILWRIGFPERIKEIALLVVAGIVATPLGTYLLIVVPELTLKRFTSVFILVSALLMLFGVRFSVKNKRVAYGLVGLFSGMLNGSISLSGPPVILFLNNLGIPKTTFRRQLTTFFFILNVVTIPMQIASGLIDGDLLLFSLKLLPALVAGVSLGLVVGHKIPADQFKRFTLALVLIMGIISLTSTF